MNSRNETNLNVRDEIEKSWLKIQIVDSFFNFEEEKIEIDEKISQFIDIERREKEKKKSY